MNCVSKQTFLCATKCYIPKRHILAILGFLGVFCVYAMRVNLSVAIIPMAGRTYSSLKPGADKKMECPTLQRYTNDKPNEYKGKHYDWNSETQGIILASFFYGFLMTQILGGILSEKFSCKWTFGLGVLITAICSLLTPLAASLGVSSIIACRVLTGAAEGITFPPIVVFAIKWFPEIERSRVTSFVCSGIMIGNIVSLPVSGLLCGSMFLGGWPSTFYVFGGVSVILFLFWIFLVYETPAEHPFISRQELLYIGQGREKESERADIPWKDIFTSLPVWSLIFSQIGHLFGFTILLTEMSTYLNGILHFDIQSNGFLSSLPFASMTLGSYLACYIFEKMRESGKVNISSIRKISNSIGLLGPAVCLLGISVSGCRPYLTVALLCLGLGLNGFIYSGFIITHIDMCPQFSGTLFGISNTIGTLGGAIGASMTGFFLGKGETLQNWSYVFYITAAVYFIAAVFFDIFASAELQSWGIEKEKNKDKN